MRNCRVCMDRDPDTGPEEIASEGVVVSGEKEAPLPRQGEGAALPLEAEVEALRGAVLSALAECCAERGYLATSIDHVVKRAGVSRLQFDELFRDKEDAYIAMSNMVLGELLTAATSAYSPDKPLVQVVRDAAWGILELMSARPTFAKVAFLDYRTATPRALQLY